MKYEKYYTLIKILRYHSQNKIAKNKKSHTTQKKTDESISKTFFGLYVIFFDCLVLFGWRTKNVIIKFKYHKS